MTTPLRHVAPLVTPPLCKSGGAVFLTCLEVADVLVNLFFSLQQKSALFCCGEWRILYLRDK